MSHEAGLVDYFPSDLKSWVKSEDIGSDGVIECKRYAGVTGIFGSSETVFEISATCMVLFRPLAEISVTISPPVAEWWPKKNVSVRPQIIITLRARAPPRANINIQ